ncbi:MAG: hypothetical protein AB7N54_16410 [Alphaproteobacteria bacterium]
MPRVGFLFVSAIVLAGVSVGLPRDAAAQNTASLEAAIATGDPEAIGTAARQLQGAPGERLTLAGDYADGIDGAADAGESGSLALAAIALARDDSILAVQPTEAADVADRALAAAGQTSVVSGRPDLAAAVALEAAEMARSPALTTQAQTPEARARAAAMIVAALQLASRPEVARADPAAAALVTTIASQVAALLQSVAPELAAIIEAEVEEAEVAIASAQDPDGDDTQTGETNEAQNQASPS